jgi:hypothetical protein
MARNARIVASGASLACLPEFGSEANSLLQMAQRRWIQALADPISSAPAPGMGINEMFTFPREKGPWMPGVKQSPAL